ncbi:MAG: hypothetical protein KatS3mg003_1736 [Candidatus Nitrosocaldaceae archaeon]|nr:MAG: hypothetical protein KatS3mg003_1736 [Candidatus Nitrosocaldaceae archaeon]
MPLEKFDKGLVEKLEENSKSIGINIYANSAVKGIKVVDGKYRVITNNHTIDTKLVHGAGRTPNIDLDNGNIAYAKVNGYLQSISNHNVYTAGDVI